MTLVLRFRPQTPKVATRFAGPGGARLADIAAIVGPPGRDATGGSFDHIQASELSIWVVNHNLGWKPAAVSVRSPGGVEVIAEVIHVSENQLQVHFAAPQSGSVRVQ
jgi:hypothetical protein